LSDPTPSLAGPSQDRKHETGRDDEAKRNTTGLQEEVKADAITETDLEVVDTLDSEAPTRSPLRNSTSPPPLLFDSVCQTEYELLRRIDFHFLSHSSSSPEFQLSVLKSYLAITSEGNQAWPRWNEAEGIIRAGQLFLLSHEQLATLRTDLFAEICLRCERAARTKLDISERVLSTIYPLYQDDSPRTRVAAKRKMKILDTLHFRMLLLDQLLDVDNRKTLQNQESSLNKQTTSNKNSGRQIQME
jgi:hypothetical protein